MPCPNVLTHVGGHLSREGRDERALSASRTMPRDVETSTTGQHQIAPSTPHKLEIVLYTVHGTASLLHPVFQDQSSPSVRGSLIATCSTVYALSLMCIMLRSPSMFHRRGPRIILYSTIIFALFTTKFDLSQIYILIPTIIDIGIVLACQEMPGNAAPLRHGAGGT